MHEITTPLCDQHSLSHPRARRRRKAAGSVSLLAAAAVSMALASSGQARAGTSTGSASTGAAFCQVADGTYQLGCRLLPGLPDGWFVPADVAISTAVVPANVR